MNIQSQEKLELKRTKEQDLRLFFMIGRKLSPMPEEKIIAILSFQLEDAFIKAKTTYLGFNLIYNGQNILMRELLEKLQVEGSVSPPTSREERVEEEPLSPERINFEQFKNCLLLAVDEFTKPEDKETLKNIIKELKQKVGGNKK